MLVHILIYQAVKLQLDRKKITGNGLVLELCTSYHNVELERGLI